MNLRLLISIAVSGAVHVGAFLAGAGLYDSYRAEPGDARLTETLTVTVGMAEPSTLVSPENKPPFRNAATAASPGPAPAPRTVDDMVGANAAEPPVSESTASPPSDSHAEAEKPTPDSHAEAGKPAPDPPADAPGEREPEPVRGHAARQLASAARPASENAAVGRASAELERTYLAEFLAELSRHKHYPRSARLRGQQGKVVVALRLKKDGEITDISLAESSRYPALDRAALRSVRRLDRFKPFPSSMKRSDWRLSVPFKYAME